MAGANQKPDTAGVRADLEAARPVASVRRLFDGDPEPGEPRNGILPGQWAPNALGLPPDCPVTPLGVDGDTMWLMDPIGQVCAYVIPFGQGHTALLFKGRDKFLKWAWPKCKKVGEHPDGKPIFKSDGWKNEDVRDAIISACTAMGPWDGVERLRGRGAWRGPGDTLVMHCGHDIVLAGHKRPQPPGVIDGYVYPARPQIPRPAPAPVEADRNPAKLLRTLFESWNWARPRVDAHLLIGWIAVAFLGAALEHRPIIYITGDAGMGKSTLQEILKMILREWLIQAVDTSAAGLYQHVGHDCVAIAVDEFEGEADTRKAEAVLKLARQAYSGGLMLRGGDRHHGVQFMARSAFLFSSINTPPLEPQDLSRMGVLQLHKLPADATEPEISPGALAMIGDQILGRLVKEWERLPYTLKAFRDEMKRGGMDARGADTFGTLLACADLIEFDGWDEERLCAPNSEGDIRPWSEILAASTMFEFEDRLENWRNCLDYMLSVPVEAWRSGNRSTVGQALYDWYHEKDFDNDVVKIRILLGQAGLGLQRNPGKDDWLAVPNNNPLLRKLLEGSKWQGKPGASVWKGALRQGAKGALWQMGQCRINGVKAKCTLISLSHLYGPGGIMTDDPPAAPPDLSPSMGFQSNPDPMIT